MASTTKVKSSKTCAIIQVLNTIQTQTFTKVPGITIAEGARIVDILSLKMEAQSMQNSLQTWQTAMSSLLIKRETFFNQMLRRNRITRKGNQIS